jgi:hypothetical protein
LQVHVNTSTFDALPHLRIQGRVFDQATLADIGRLQLKLRLHQQQAMALGFAQRGHWGQNPGQGNEAQIPHDQVKPREVLRSIAPHRLKHGGVQVAGMAFFVGADTRVIAQTRMQLPMTHVNATHMGGTVAQQAGLAGLGAA